MESDHLENLDKTETKQNKARDIFKNLKADYFLEKLFNSLKKKKLLFIAKYNKNIKKRIHININDYKEYSEKYTPIEIEIIPKKTAMVNLLSLKKIMKNIIIYILIIMKKK